MSPNASAYQPREALSAQVGACLVFSQLLVFGNIVVSRLLDSLWALAELLLSGWAFMGVGKAVVRPISKYI